MTNKKLLALMVVTMIFVIPNLLTAHCQVPCGIYGDSLRIDLMQEHTETIEKSMNSIMELKKADDINYNQLVRWINNKDEHANKFSEIVTYYFLAQRIKPVDQNNEQAYKKYQTHLELLHKMMVYAMRAKQTTDLKNVETLRDLIKQFEDSYFHEH